MARFNNNNNNNNKCLPAHDELGTRETRLVPPKQWRALDVLLFKEIK